MAQKIFTFRSPVDTNETIDIITKVVAELKGKTKIEGAVVTAKWVIKDTTIFRHKFTFYVGKDMVRVVTDDGTPKNTRIKWEYKNGYFSTSPIVKQWHEFVRILTLMYSNYDFELEYGDFHIVEAKIMSDGVEQVFTSTSKKKPSIGGAIVGGALFGGVGAIIGGTSGKTRTSGSSSTVIASTVVVTVRYSNGLNLEGTISKNSSEYNRILTNLSALSEE